MRDTITGSGAVERVERLIDELVDVDSVKYWLITPEDLARAVVHVIDQPWGISLSDVTVRASGEDYLY